MSGICGIVEFYRNEASFCALSAMSRALAIRGPDKETIFTEKGVGLCHRLLDISQSENRQVAENDRVCAGIDGTFHNLAYLVRVFNFKCPSFPVDTLIAGYESQGLAFIEQLEGSFALFVFDKNENRLILARDKMGTKPLYYYHDQERLLFSSEIRAILSSGFVTSEVNWQAVGEYFTFQFPLAENTFFDKITVLPPSTILTCTNGTISLERYWNYAYEPATLKSSDYFVDKLRNVLRRGIESLDVKDRLRIAHLSGGLDSSIISTLLAVNGDELKTVSGVYPYGERYDESPYAAAVSKMLGSWHAYVYPTAADVTAYASKMLDDLLEPVSDVGFSRYYLAQKVKESQRDVKVVFCGQGADELFGGYTFYLDYLRSDGTLPLYLRSYKRRKLFSREDLKQLFSDQVFVRMFSPNDPIEKYRTYFGSEGHPLEDAVKADLEIFLPYWLRIEDHIESSISREVRYPFLYYEVVKLAMRIPQELKICGNEQKHILRRAFADVLPQEILDHEKIGFRTPFSLWFRNELSDFAEDILLSHETANRAVYRQEFVREVLHKTKTGELNYGWQMWTLIQFELWLRKYIDQR